MKKQTARNLKMFNCWNKNRTYVGKRGGEGKYWEQGHFTHWVVWVDARVIKFLKFLFVQFQTFVKDICTSFELEDLLSPTYRLWQQSRKLCKAESFALWLIYQSELRDFCARQWQWNALTWSTIPSREDNTVGWISLCICMIREQRHMEGVARIGPVSAPPAAWLPCACWGCADGVAWSPASSIFHGYWVPLHTSLSINVLWDYKTVLYLAAVTPPCLPSAVPATSPQEM